MKKVLPTILATLIFLSIIGAYALGIIKMISQELTLATILIPFIILAVFSVIAVLLIIVLVKRVKAIKEEDVKNYDKY